MGIDQGISATACECLHERISDANGQIEIRHLGWRLFECDEVEDIRVINTEDAHIRATSGPALLDDVRREVEQAHEGNGPGGHAARRRDPVVVRAHVAKRESRASARLVDERLMFQAVIDGGQGVFDREDETGGELLEASPGVHQCGRIGKKIEPSHAVVPALGRVGQPAGAGVESFSLCDVGRDTPE